ncbi:MAG: hypothetical protein WCR31_07960 [Treponema sp.]
MKTIEWFACLSFEKEDILLPRDVILECRYDEGRGSEVGWNDKYIRPVNLDLILKTSFGFSMTGSLNCTLILHGLNDFAVQTEAVPVMKEIALSELRPVSGLAEDFLFRSGIIAFRFLQNRIQYVVDIQKLMAKAGSGV